MSGHKKMTVSISPEEHRRLHEADMKLRFLEQKLPETTRQVVSESNSVLSQAIQLLENRQEQFIANTAGLDESIQEFEKRSGDNFIQMQSHVQEQVTQFCGSLSNHLDEIMTQQSSEYEDFRIMQYDDLTNHLNLLNSHQNNFENIVINYSRQIDERFREFDDQLEQRFTRAQDWINTDVTLYNFLLQNYTLEPDDQNKLVEIQKQVLLAANNLESGMPEACVSLAQQMYFVLSQLHHQLEKEANERLILTQTTWERLKLLEAHVQSSQWISAVDLEGNEVATQIEVNYWTDNRLTIFLEKIQENLDSLMQLNNDGNRDKLIHMIKEEIPHYEQEFIEILLKARYAVLSSQLRINIAELIVHSLNDQGFDVEKAGYITGDMRTTFSTQLRDLEGNSVIVYVAPENSAEFENEIHLISLDKDQRTKHELFQRAHEVAQSLSDHGLNVGIPDFTNQFGNPRKSKSRQISEQKTHYSITGS
jgi:hypothetical protein